VRLIRVSFFFLAAITSGAASAHHSFSAFFDNDNVGDIQGEIVETSWVNPHTSFKIRSESGEIWKIETAPVNRLQRLALDGTISVGDRVTFSGAFSRLGRNEMLATNMTYANGKEVLLDPGFAGRLGLLDRVSPNDQPNTKISGDEPQGIYRVWTRDRGPNDQDPVRSFTAAALAAREAWDPVVDDPALNCIAPGMPVIMDTPFPIAFEEGVGQIQIQIEQWDGRRIVHMDSNFNPNSQPSSLMGTSIGRWEGRALVIETSNMSWPYVDEFGTPKSENLTIVERITFNEDNHQMTWEATSSDPTAYEGQAFLGRAGYKWVPGEEIKPYNCTLAD
jgi:hypothetical protein